MSHIAHAHHAGWEIEALFLAAGTVPESLDVPTDLAMSRVAVHELGPGVMAVSYTHLTLPTIYSV